MSSFITYTFWPSIIRWIKSRRMIGRACSRNGDEECIYNFGGKAKRKETTRKKQL
jgi:hypothetical protein